MMRDIDAALYESIYRNDLKAINESLIKGANINAACDGTISYSRAMWTPLLTASSNNKIDAALLLIDSGADCSAKSDSGLNILHFACRKGQYSIVVKCLEKGMNINQSDNDGEVPLISASRKSSDNSEEDYVKIINLLVDRGANVNACDSEGKSALYYASGEHLLQRMEVLISKGANVNCQTNDGWTPLFSAISDVCSQSQVIAALRLLIAKGANVNSREFEHNCTVTDLASELDLSEVVAFLRSSNNSSSTATIKINNANQNSSVSPEQISKKSDGCFIATACYGSYDAPEVLILRQYRDQIMFKSVVGKMIIGIYYKLSPPVAALIARNDTLRFYSKRFIVDPLIRFARRCLS